MMNRRLSRTAGRIPGPAIIVLSLAVLCPSSAAAGFPHGFIGQDSLYHLRRSWPGPQGCCLPFDTDADLMQFLRTARVVSTETISEGINRTLRVELEREGVSMRGAFRQVDVFKPPYFRDHFSFERAAYELSRLLGMDNVPPTVRRRIDGTRGTLQAWVEGAITERSRKRHRRPHPDQRRWFLETQMMYLFDNLIYNEDRNQGNMLYDRDWKLWMIDHTRAFRPFSELRNSKVLHYCERGVWEKLTTLDPESVRRRLRRFLSDMEVDTLLTRWRLLVDHFGDLIRRKGEGQVLWSRQDLQRTRPRLKKLARRP